MSLIIKSRSEKGIKAKAFPGDTIDDTCREAIEMVSNKRVDVYFEFNGVELKATESSTKDELVNYFHGELSRKRDEYLNSEQYKEDHAKQAKQLQALQIKIDDLLSELKSLALTDDSVVSWVGSFAEINDHKDLVYDNSEIISILVSAGYESNAEVGNPAVKTNKATFARWLVGQAIANLERGMPIHPVAEKFSRDYLNMFQAA